MQTDNSAHSAETLTYPSFDDVWPQVRRAVQQLAVALVGRDDADDICQLVALRILQRHTPFHDSEHARAWALRVARNACHDLFRKRQRAREESLDDGTWSDGAALPPALQVRAAASPETLLLAKERSSRLCARIDTLPPLLRKAAQLHFVAEESYETVARSLSIREATARKRIQHARQLLRKAEAEGSDLPPAGSGAPPVVAGDGAMPVVHALCVTRDDGSHADAVIAVTARPRTRSIGWMRGYIEQHNGSRIRLDLAHALLQEGQLHEAAAVYEGVLEAGCAQAQPFLELTSLYTALGQHDSVAATCLQASEQLADPLERQHLAALALRTRGDGEDALRVLESLTRGEEAMASHWRAYGEALLDAGRPMDAEEALNRCMQLDVHEPLAAALLCRALWQQGKLHAAAGVLGGSVHVPAIECLLQARALARQLDDAAALLRLLPPKRAATINAAATIAAASGSWIEAVRIAAEGVAAMPRHDGARRTLARALLAAGRSADAASVLAPLVPTRATCLLQCRVTAAGGYLQRGQQLAEEVRSRFPRDAILLDAAGSMLLACGAPAPACALAREAVALQPAMTRLCLHLAEALEAAGKYGDAVAALQEQWDGSDDAAACALLLARCHTRLGTGGGVGWMEAALKASEMLSSADPAAAQLYRGAALELLGRTGEAQSAYCEAILLHLPHPQRRAVEAGLVRITRHRPSPSQSPPC